MMKDENLKRLTAGVWTIQEHQWGTVEEIQQRHFVYASGASNVRELENNSANIPLIEQAELTLQGFIPFLHPQYCLVVIVVRKPLPTVTIRCLLFSIDCFTFIHLLSHSYHPRMLEKFSSRDSEVAILLETMVKEIFHDR
jgi:hypothetical protein